MYIKQLYSFLEQLGANNDRNWFALHRSEYDSLRQAWLEDIGRLIAAMTAWEPAMSSQNARSCAYRIYRDIRFSRDKSPFKTYFSAAFSPQGRNSRRAGYYLQMGPGRFGQELEAGLYGGIWCPEPAMLRKIRRAIVDNDDEFAEIVSNPQLRELYPGWTGRSLKRPPKGFSNRDPFIDVVKLNDIGRYRPLTISYFDDPQWPVKAAADFSVLKPLIDFINYSIDEE